MFFFSQGRILRKVKERKSQLIGTNTSDITSMEVGVEPRISSTLRTYFSSSIVCLPSAAGGPAWPGGGPQCQPPASAVFSPINKDDKKCRCHTAKKMDYLLAFLAIALYEKMLITWMALSCIRWSASLAWNPRNTTCVGGNNKFLEYSTTKWDECRCLVN